MRTERDRARSAADVFVGPRCNARELAFRAPSIVFAGKYTPGVYEGAFPEILLPRQSELCGVEEIS